MNLMYEDLPLSINVNGQYINIVTDFRECVKLIDILEDVELNPIEKRYLVLQYFKEQPEDFETAMDCLASFVTMDDFYKASTNLLKKEEQTENKKDVYSFSVDYPFIFSAFMRDYGINIKTIPYMHWWTFRMLFDGLSEDNEIKQRIMYRSIDLSEIKDKDERKRIDRIQRSIKLPESSVSDYDIGDAFDW